MTVDVEAIASSGSRHVAAEEAVAVRRCDHERVPATASDHISAENIVGAAEAGSLECEMDAVPPGTNDDVAGDPVAAPLLDQDSTLVAQAAVAGTAATAAIAASALLTVSVSMDPPGVGGCSGPATL